MRRLFHFLIAAALAGAAEKTPAQLADLEQNQLVQLLGIRRVFVDRFTGGETAAQMRELIMSSLHGARLFIVTENQERADAILRGSAEDLVFTDVHSSSEGINARAFLGNGRSTRSEARTYAGGGVGENESNRAEERKHEALSAVRLVNRDGDVIWSTTQESQGGKFRGASADVADKITKRLSEDFERARRLKRP